MPAFPRALRFVTAAAIAASLAALGPAAADTVADECVDGPAATASAERPHIVDVAGDTHAAAIHKDAMDLRGGWIGKTDTGFTANIKVAGIAVHPANTRYNFAYTGPKGEHYVQASANEIGWTFNFGWLDTSQTPNRQTKLGDTTGKVDMAAGVVSIDLPASAVPAAPTQGEEVEMPVLKITSQLLIGTSVSGGGLLQVDLADDVCKAVLYEADPSKQEETQTAGGSGDGEQQASDG